MTAGLGLTHAARPLERSQVVWRRTLELVEPVAAPDQFTVALELLRMAGNDPTTVVHALSLGWTQQREDPESTLIQRGVDMLEWAVEFLGTRSAQP